MNRTISVKSSSSKLESQADLEMSLEWIFLPPMFHQDAIGKLATVIALRLMVLILSRHHRLSIIPRIRTVPFHLQTFLLSAHRVELAQPLRAWLKEMLISLLVRR